jgi:hypothetical protein
MNTKSPENPPSVSIYAIRERYTKSHLRAFRRLHRAMQRLKHAILKNLARGIGWE